MSQSTKLGFKYWYSALELIDIPGLPGSVQKIVEKSKREEWISRKRTAQGGGNEYHINSLPIETSAYLISLVKETEAGQWGMIEAQRMIIKDKITIAAQKQTREQELSKTPGLTIKEQDRMDARIRVLNLISNYQSTHNLVSRWDATKKYIVVYNTGQVDIDVSIRQHIPTLSFASISRWRNKLKVEGITALAGKRSQQNSNTSTIDKDLDLREAIIGILVDKPHTSVANIKKVLDGKFKGNLNLSIRSIERWIKKWKTEHAQVFCAVTNPDEWKNKYMSAFGNASGDVERLNQLWELDSTPADIMLTDGRHSIIGIIDVYSRRFKLLVSKTSKATAIASTIRHALTAWGVPEIMKTDNGSDYIGKHMIRVYTGLDVDHKQCNPFCPWEKPHIERAFRTFSYDIFELLDGYIGHNVADRKAIENRKQFSDRLMKKIPLLKSISTRNSFKNFVISG